MRILILGGGGREHALAWKISQSPLCKALFIAPGNAGTEAHGNNVLLDIENNEAIAGWVAGNAIDMVVVGPEAPLVNGVWDFLRQNEATKDCIVVGPSQAGAQLEGSKAFAKAFMQQYSIPTAAYREFTSEQLDQAVDYLRSEAKAPYVLKADGLAAGKGVVICEESGQAVEEMKAMLSGKFGAASSKVVVEEFLSGIEFSVFVLTDGKNYKILPVAKDYKRIGEGDTGPNTGGMGAVSPPPFVDATLMDKVEKRIIQPTIQGLQERQMAYHGFIFFGLIEVGGEPFVIEYNCRLGDPETEVVLPRLRNDLVELFVAMHEGSLDAVRIEEDPRAAATVILASGGYPGSYEKGKIITGLDRVEGSIVFHAGTKRTADGTIVTSGGRVMAITSLAPDFRQAIATSNANAERIQFEGKYFRKDIGFDL
ncbi:MAG: phosphoribosylamine--glycine ligase [Bacteroidetes bacterium]|nr:MAG: phosphoribosylamine--glycine ligase [Bacteroidota bacterium]